MPATWWPAGSAERHRVPSPGKLRARLAAGQELEDGLQGRNTARNPSVFLLDIRFSKVFVLGSAGNLELLVDVFNVFNNANRYVSGVGVFIGSPNFGVLDGLLSEPRQVQLGVRYRF